MSYFSSRFKVHKGLVSFFGSKVKGHLKPSGQVPAKALRSILISSSRCNFSRFNPRLRFGITALLLAGLGGKA